MGCACSKPVAAEVAPSSSAKGGDLGMRDTQPLLSANNSGITDDGHYGTKDGTARRAGGWDNSHAEPTQDRNRLNFLLFREIDYFFW